MIANIFNIQDDRSCLLMTSRFACRVVLSARAINYLYQDTNRGILLCGSDIEKVPPGFSWEEGLNGSWDLIPRDPEGPLTIEKFQKAIWK